MALLKLETGSTFEIDVSVRESDQHSKSVFIKFERNYRPDSIHRCNEMFLSPAQLELLGRFLVRQADEIRTAQAMRTE